MPTDDEGLLAAGGPEGPDSDPDSAAATGAEPVPAPRVDAPWLLNPDLWSTQEAEARAVRPGWFCYVKESRGFVPVASVSRVTGRNGRVCFIDLADGRSLALPEDAELFVRRPRA